MNFSGHGAPVQVTSLAARDNRIGRPSSRSAAGTADGMIQTCYIKLLKAETKETTALSHIRQPGIQHDAVKVCLSQSAALFICTF